MLPHQLLRVVRALASVGIFQLDAIGSVRHTPKSLLLRSDAPGTLHHAARFWAGEGSWGAWEALDVALQGKCRTRWPGERAASPTCARSRTRRACSTRSWRHVGDNRHNALAGSYDFSRATTIVDVGGGNGEMLRRILARYPDARGIVLDREDVVAAITDEARAGGRITMQGGSFFDAVPAGCDIYVLCRVLHDWADDDALRILKSCRTAMGPNACLLVVEGLLHPDPTRGDRSEYLIDMQMMAMFGNARERTEAEFGELLGRAGFELVRTIATNSSVSILEAAPCALGV